MGKDRMLNDLNQPTVQLGDNILKFRDTHEPIFPYLKKILDSYLTMVVTSVKPELLFSKAGKVITDIGYGLTSENLNNFCFLGLVWKIIRIWVNNIK